ncbi:hypothetical protein BH11BAC5_BH11BAC5_06340 [soil metagenome]
MMVNAWCTKRLLLLNADLSIKKVIKSNANKEHKNKRPACCCRLTFIFYKADFIKWVFEYLPFKNSTTG